MKVLLDSNILLDIALKREPFSKEAFDIFSLIQRKKIQGFISALTVSHLHYIINKNLSRLKADEFVKDVLTIFDIAPVDKEILINAIEMNLPDFEDAIQLNSAKKVALTVIITRNKKDFLQSEYPFLHRLNS
jgi:predicted nucleic acid-binding protein